MLFAAACDRFARVEVNNDTAFDARVSVNGRASVVAPAGGRVYTGPGVNERLRSLKITLLSDSEENKTIEFNTYADDIVLHVLGPPLEVIVTHERHPSGRRTEEP